MRRPLLALTTLLLALPVIAKELYITVRRDFAPTESPKIELNYSRYSPFTIRVYRPTDMREFIASQIDLRRAWRQPKVELNAARYLFAGLNRTRLDLDWLRVASNSKMRGRLMDTYGGASWSPAGTKLSEGPTVLIAGPDKFELVTEFSFEPDSEDTKVPFDVPGFDWWFSREGGLRQKDAELPKLVPGFYLVQVIQGDLEGQVVLVVNDLTAELQQTSGSALVRVARRSGTPVAGADVEVRNLQGAWIAKSKTDRNGILELKDMHESELLVVIRDKDSTAIIDTDFFPTVVVFPDVYLYTDRPLYRPGCTIRFRGILREKAGGLSQVPKQSPASPSSALVSLVDLAGTTVVHEVGAPLSPFGTFDGELDLGQANVNGVYRVKARLGDMPHIGELRIKEYIKPIFLLKLATQQETLKVGGQLTATVSVERYAGGIPQGVTYSAQLVRSRAETPQWVEDAGLGGTGSAVTYGWDAQRQSDAVDVPFPVASRDDLEFDAEGKSELVLDLPKALPGPPNYDYKFVLKLFAKDRDGNTASLSTTFADRRSEVVALVRTSSVLATPTQPAKLQVRAVSPSGKPYGRVKGTLRWALTPYKAATKIHEVEFFTGEDGRYETAIPTDERGRLDVLATLYDHANHPTASTATILIAGREGGAPVVDVPELTIFQERTSFAPGESARAFALLPQGWGEGGSNRGRLFLTVAGRSIYEKRIQEVNGLSAWITQPIKPEYGTAAYCVIAYPDSQRGWVERTLTFTIPPRDKALSVVVTPRESKVSPGQGQSLALRVTGTDGKGVRAEVSVAVVDKAVLALQPEFRPSLLEFFYPIERLNLMSFFSREFQAYGYGERLAGRFGPNHFLSATKPPKPDKDYDTAYWSAHVLTDTDGNANVTFEMPGNQTTWTVAAVAVDTNGRFGEGRSEFLASSPIGFSSTLPRFLRVGDTADLRFRVTNEQSTTAEVKASIELPSELTATAPISGILRIEPKNEAGSRGTVTLSALAPSGTTTIRTTVQMPAETARFSNQLRTLPGSVAVSTTYLARVSEPVLTVPKPGERLSDVRVFAASSFAGSLLPTLHWLVTYPYGCVEQTTSTTISNLVILHALGGETAKTPVQPTSTLDRLKSLFLKKTVTDTWREATPTRQDEVLANAAEFSRSGLVRLKSMQNSDGSFGWWPGSHEANPTMTLIVLSLLASVDDPQAINAIDARRAFGWLKEKISQQASSEGVALAFIEARLQKLKVLPEAGSSSEANLRFQGEWALVEGTFLDKALTLLALKYSGLDSKLGLKELANRLLLRTQAAVMVAVASTTVREPQRWTPSTNWPEYPGRLTSTIAACGRALAEYGQVDTEARGKLGSRLLEGFDGTHFGSTFESSAVLVHSGWLIREELNRAGTVPQLRVLIAGVPLAPTAVTTRPTLGGTELAIDPAEAARGPLTFENLDGLSVHVRVTSERPFATSEPVTGRWELRREYYRIDEREGTVTPLDGPIRVGDLVYVQLSFKPTGHRNYWSSSYYMLRDDVPAGFVVVEEDKIYDAAPYRLDLHGAGYSLRDIRAEEVRFFFAFPRGWMDRAYQTGYVMRAQHAGDFTAGVARIEDFYDESHFSETSSRRLGVEPLPGPGKS